MRLGVMQPYFFPYIGYFELINRTDQWIVFDNVQYIRHGWMNRNRVLHPGGEGWMYVTAPLQKPTQTTLIKDVQVQPGSAWKEQILRQLEHYRKKAPFYAETTELVRQALAPDELSLSKLNVHGLALICEYLNIKFDYRYHSEMDVVTGPIEVPGDWALRLSEACGAREYINPPGGADLFEPEKFRKAGVQLTIQPFADLRYACGSYRFEPALSIIDVCMWNGPDQIKNYLSSFSYEASAA